MTYSLNTLAALDPKKLAAKFLSLPDGAIVVEINASGFTMAMPAPKEPVAGGIYYRAETIDIWTGAEYKTLARLIERDGRPTLVSARVQMFAD